LKIVIHVGMHKTGSSSIQHTFARLQHPGFEYINWGASGNHSALFVLLFEDADKLADYHGFKSRGSEFTKRLPTMREQWTARVSAQLARTGDKTIVFSAEDISSPKFKIAVSRLRDFFAQWSNDMSVIGYARSPAGFIASAFQQRLKGGRVPDLFRGGASPNYRARFEKMDRIFGRENVRLKEFVPHNLLNGDVVQDFAREIGAAPLAEDRIIRTNESLSLEAVALLYVQRKLGQGFVQGFKDAHAANNSFISRLATIGTRKFAFSPQMLAPIIETERDDIAWMQDRLGHEFSAPGAAHKDAIHSLDDLLDIALGQFDAVQELLGEHAVSEGRATTETLVHALERLRETCYEKVLDAAARRDANIAARHSKHKGNSALETTTDRPEPTEQELNIRRKLAHLLWIQDNADAMPESIEDRKEMYQAVKRDYLRKAANLVQRLRNHGIEVMEQPD